VLLDNVVKPSSLDHKVIAFTLDKALPAGTKVSPYARDPVPTSVSSLPDLVDQTLSSPAWFFWVDDDPLARFSHPTRYVLVDAGTGEFTVTNQGWWPYVNGQAVTQWVDTTGRWDAKNWAYSNVPAADISRATASIISQSRPWASTWFSLSVIGPVWDRFAVSKNLPGGEAIVPVNGYAPGQTDAGFGNDIVHATQFGSDAQIPSYQPTGKTLKDIEDAITKAQAGGANDVFLYWTGHGGRAADGSSYLNFKGTRVTPQQLTDILKKFPKVKFKVVIDACFGGGFAGAMMATDNVSLFFSASSATEVSYGGGFAGGGSFSDGLWDDLLKVLNSPELQKRARDDAAGRYPEFVGWLMIARESALEKDGEFQAGRTHPVGRVATPPPPPTTTPTPTPTPTPTQKPWMGGLFSLVTSVLSDPAGHRPYVNLFNTINATVDVVGDPTITVSGNGNWVTVNGLVQPDGSFTATGRGTVAGYPNVSVVFKGTWTQYGGFSGQYTMGAGGELPTGQAITYSVTATRQ